MTRSGPEQRGAPRRLAVHGERNLPQNWTLAIRPRANVLIGQATFNFASAEFAIVISAASSGQAHRAYKQADMVTLLLLIPLY